MLYKATYCGEWRIVTQKIADDMDRKILKELMSDARLPNNGLAERVGLSASACLRRLRRLEDADIIQASDVKNIGAKFFELSSDETGMSLKERIVV